MYGLSSRDSLSKIQTRWVQAVEENANAVRIEHLKNNNCQVLEAVEKLKEKVSELENLCHSLDERICALELQQHNLAPQEEEDVLPQPEVDEEVVY